MPIRSVDIEWFRTAKVKDWGELIFSEVDIVLKAGFEVLSRAEPVGDGMFASTEERWYVPRWIQVFAELADQEHCQPIQESLVYLLRTYPGTLEAAWRIGGVTSMSWSIRDLLTDALGDRPAAQQFRLLDRPTERTLPGGAYARSVV